MLQKSTIYRDWDGERGAEEQRGIARLLHAYDKCTRPPDWERAPSCALFPIGVGVVSKRAVLIVGGVDCWVTMEQGAGQKRARQDPPHSAAEVVEWLTARIAEGGLGAMDAQASAALIARFSEEGVDAEALSNFSKDDLRDEFKLGITRNPPPRASHSP